ncbi:hypothetical protein MASR1M90_03200 [Desulfovibrionales bacterium]
MISRRDLLLGMVRRLRDTSGEKPVSGIGADIAAADAAYACKDYATARNLYKEVLKDNRNHKEARIYQGLCHYHLGEYIQAKDTLILVVKSHPDEYLARLYLGLAYARRDLVEKCMDIWAGLVSSEHVTVMREINVQRALYEMGDSAPGLDIALAVEQAMAQSAENMLPRS